MHNPTIFVVEDNLIYQALIAKELEAVSNNIHFYTQGEECIVDLEKAPDIVILDYNLEGVINGLETLEAIRQQVPGLPAILFSNQAGLYSKENLTKYGSFDFLEKCEHSFQHLSKMIGQSLDSLAA
jgi:two-component system, OmpR family, response regulator